MKFKIKDRVRIVDTCKVYSNPTQWAHKYGLTNFKKGFVPKENSTGAVNFIKSYQIHDRVLLHVTMDDGGEDVIISTDGVELIETRGNKMKSTAEIAIEYWTRIKNGENFDEVNEDLFYEGQPWRIKSTGIPPRFSVKPPGTYSWKPKTINVNGYEVVPPMKEFPKKGAEYFSMVTLIHEQPYQWLGSGLDEKLFKFGIFDNKEDCLRYHRAIYGLNPDTE